jgi:hypothetical protein
MRIPGACCWTLLLWALIAGCGGKLEADVLLERADAGTQDPHDAGPQGPHDAGPPPPPDVIDVGVLPAYCKGEPIPARNIDCSGLYTNVEDKTFAKNVREFSPAVALWSDGLEKHRWIILPEGEKIDASDPNAWKFPAGTKLFKEFSSEGKRLETRLFQKKTNGIWVHTSYAWNEDETEATSGEGKLVPMPSGELHQIPTGAQCEQCHRGNRDSVLGFENVLLGLDGAKGVTLADLVEEGLLDPPPESTELSIGDDGTGLASPVLGWLHVNCGITCHNANTNASAFSAGMILKLQSEQLDGRPSTDFEARTTTLNVEVNNPNFSGKTRITPGDPGSSLLAELISQRISDAADDNAQMPPIASKKVDHENVDRVVAWIKSMEQVE